jgi:hypothetical protein
LFFCFFLYISALQNEVHHCGNEVVDFLKLFPGNDDVLPLKELISHLVDFPSKLTVLAPFKQEPEDTDKALYVLLEWADYEAREATNYIRALQQHNVSVQPMPSADFGLRHLCTTHSSPILSTLSASQPMETLLQTSISSISNFEAADFTVWTKYLQTQAGFLGKRQLMPYYDTVNNGSVVYQFIGWNSLQEWKSLPQDELAAVFEQFTEAMNGSPNELIPIPSNGNGLRILRRPLEV